MILRRKTAILSVIAVVSVLFLAANCVWADRPDHSFFDKLKKRGIRNVIVMVPDGCDQTVQTLAAWYKKHSGEYPEEEQGLQVDKMQNAAVQVHMANSVITGSAAAATAFATGHKTTVRFLGVGPRTNDLLTGMDPTAEPYGPVASILEAAKMRRMATGIAVTSRVTHATPAAFACHIEDRGWDNDIMEHMVYNNVDVVFGGGFRHLIPAGTTYTPTFDDTVTWKGRRTDGDNLYEVLLDRGYQFVDNRDDMLALKKGPVWGLFDDSHMQPDMDRQWFAPHEPSLAEMVGKAIDLLSKEKHGFFLMVEGSQVDWAGHNNDPIYMVKDFIAFDDAVKVACDFAEKDGRTLVLAYPDHNTGGMKLGHYDTAMGYTETTVEDMIDPLKGMTMSANGVVAKMYDEKLSMTDALAEYWNVKATETDIEEIEALAPYVGTSYAMARVISKNHTVVGWTTHGHNGETVPVWVYGADAPAGTIDNTELAEIAADAMGMDLGRVSDRLYIDIKAVTDDYDIDVDVMADCDKDGKNCTYPGEIEGNGVLRVNEAEFPINKDYMIYDGEEYPLPGVTVYASGHDDDSPDTPDETVYISRKAVRLLKILGQL